MKRASKPPKTPGTESTATLTPAISTNPAASNKATTSLRPRRLEGSKSDSTTTSIKPTVAKLIPKEQSQLTKEEREIQRLRGRMYSIVNDAVSYLHEVVQGNDKGNRTRMRACESFIRFLPDLEHSTGSQPLHLHLNVPRPDRKS